MWNVYNNKGLQRFSRLCHCSTVAGDHNNCYVNIVKIFKGGGGSQKVEDRIMDVPGGR